MINITAKTIIKDGKKDQFLEVAKILVEKSREEKGNISYGLFQDIENTNIVTFLETWKDQEALNLHKEFQHFKENIEKIIKFSESIEVNLYEKLI